MEDEPFNYTPAIKLIINKDYIDDIKENIIIHPSSLPMVCKPRLWSDSDIGGFLINKEQQVSIITGSQFQDHEISNKEVLYKAVNTLNSNMFSINTLLLEYLENEGSYLLNSSKEGEGEEIEKMNVLQEIITLRLANVFKNIPGEYSSLTAAAEAIAKQVGVGKKLFAGGPSGADRRRRPPRCHLARSRPRSRSSRPRTGSCVRMSRSCKAATTFFAGELDPRNR